jgi:hypothetical protein
MSDRITHIIAEIRDKFYHVKNELKQESEKNALLESEIASLQTKQSEIASVIVAKQNIIDAMHLENLSLKKQLEDKVLQMEEQSSLIVPVVNHDDLINDLVKEIDTCISQLKK